MSMWVYALIGIALVLLLVGGYCVLDLAAKAERCRESIEANEQLINKVRKLEAANRRQASQLSAKEYQVNSMWEERYAEAQDTISRLERELKVKDALLKSMEGKIEVAG